MRKCQKLQQYHDSWVACKCVKCISLVHYECLWQTAAVLQWYSTLLFEFHLFCTWRQLSADCGQVFAIADCPWRQEWGQVRTGARSDEVFQHQFMPGSPWPALWNTPHVRVCLSVCLSVCRCLSFSVCFMSWFYLPNFVNQDLCCEQWLLFNACACNNDCCINNTEEIVMVVVVVTVLVGRGHGHVDTLTM